MAISFDGRTKDLEKMELDKLRSIFPDCFVEDKLNIDKLLTIVGEHCLDDYEKYEFRWKGKSEALLVAQQRSMATLRPCVEESVDWDNTQNLYIEGDNLEVMRLLQKNYHRKVKMIYIDPPYNTGQDFVYKDDYTDSIGNYKRITEQESKSNADTSGRYHTEWLNMMYPRLRMAKHLLREDGIIFISIDDNEVHNLRKICDDVFGEDNFVACIPWRKRTAKSDVPFGVSQDYEWIISYARSGQFRANVEGGTRKYYETDDLSGRPWRIHDLTKQTSASERPNSFFDMVNPKNGDVFPANPNRTWAITKETFEKYYADNRVVFPGDYDFLNISKPALRYFKADDMDKAGESFGFIPLSTKLPDDIGMTQDGTKNIADLFESKIFGFPKPVALIHYLVKASTSLDKDCIIIDFFSGSATTAHAVMQLNAEDNGNRRFIMVQLPEKCTEDSEAYKAGYKTICEIGKERIRRAGAKIIAERDKQMGIADIGEDEKSLDVGFRVFKLDTSNIKKWDSTPINKPTPEQIDLFMQRLNNMIDSVKHDRSNLDMVFEILIKLGADLCEAVTPIEIDGITAYAIGAECRFMVCLDDNVTVEIAEQMAEYAPGLIVFGDKCFKDTTALANVDLALKDMGIDIQII